MNQEMNDIITNDKHEHEYQMIMSNRHMISGVMPDWMIRRYCRDFNMISPFEDHNLKPGVISSGLGSYTYDIRLAWSFKIFSPVFCGEVNPKNFDPKVFTEINLIPEAADKSHLWENFAGGIKLMQCKYCNQQVTHESFAKKECPKAPRKATANSILIPPNSFALGESVETFSIPPDVLALTIGKSTYARCGIVLNITPAEPGWTGRLTIEVSNTTPLPARVFCGEGIGAMIFFRTLANCDRDYAAKQGIYQGQSGVVGPRVRSQ